MEIIEKLRILRRRDGHKDHFIEGRYQHCADRMAERFSEEFTYDEWERLCAAVMMDDDMVEWIDRAADADSSLVQIKYRGETMLVYFSETAYLILTVLPRNDARLLYLRENRYIAKAQSETELQVRDARRALAEKLPFMEVNHAGFLVVNRDTDVEEDKEPGIMGDALKAIRPTLSLRAPVIEQPPRSAPAIPALNHRVTSAFAQLERELIAREEEAEAVLHGSADRIDELHREIAAIRLRDVATVLRRDMIRSSKEVAARALKHFGDGEIADADALALLDQLTPKAASEENRGVTPLAL